MTRVKAASQDGLRSILCLAFDTHVSLGERRALEAYLIDRREVVHALEAEGCFDFMIEAEFSGLPQYHAFLADLVSEFAPILKERRASFVCRRFIIGADRAIWIRQNGKRLRVDLTRVERVTAEGDYVRIRFAGQDHLHHATMGALEAMLDADRYIRIHRSTILQMASIALTYRGERCWMVRCTDGSEHRVARAYVEAFLERIDAHSATARGNSAKIFNSGEDRLSNSPKDPSLPIQNERPLVFL